MIHTLRVCPVIPVDCNRCLIRKIQPVLCLTVMYTRSGIVQSIQPQNKAILHIFLSWHIIVNDHFLFSVKISICRQCKH